MLKLSLAYIGESVVSTVAAHDLWSALGVPLDFTSWTDLVDQGPLAALVAKGSTGFGLHRRLTLPAALVLAAQAISEGGDAACAADVCKELAEHISKRLEPDLSGFDAQMVSSQLSRADRSLCNTVAHAARAPAEAAHKAKVMWLVLNGHLKSPRGD